VRSKLSFILMSFVLATPALAVEHRLVKLDTRPGVSSSFYYMKQDASNITVVLLPGGSGAIGMKNGVPTSNNFLVRSRDYFAANGFNVALVERPSDKEDLDYSFRVSPEHIEDLRQVAVFLKKDTGFPVWLVGTSRGTVSATAAAIAFGNEELAGIVLTSSVTSRRKTGAVPYQKLDLIRIPALVLHHEYDGCKDCVPRDVSLITRGLKNAPVRKEIFVTDGANPRGDPCQGSHWHGFIGMEKEAVEIISKWIKKPSL
jgi:hypothetical protein